jgi:hypothetical protein
VLAPDQPSQQEPDMMAGLPASYFCIKAFSETDQTQDLKKIDVPTAHHPGRRRPDRSAF